MRDYNSIRPVDDNVVLMLEPVRERVQRGVILPGTRKRRQKDVVMATVIRSGPGYRLRNGHGPLVPNEVAPGDKVLVDHLAGQDYALDRVKPRQNHGVEDGLIRIVRHDEIMAVIEEI